MRGVASDDEDVGEDDDYIDGDYDDDDVMQMWIKNWRRMR